MEVSERERTLERLGVKVRDNNGNIRSAEELTTDVMELFDKCDGEDKARLLFLVALAFRMDERS